MRPILLVCSFILCHGFVLALPFSHLPYSYDHYHLPHSPFGRVSPLVSHPSPFPISNLSTTSCRGLPFARSWETHGADLDSIPFLLVACPCGFSDFSDFGLVVLLITSGCPIAHSAAFDRQPVHLSFSDLWFKETEGASFLFVSLILSQARIILRVL